MSTPNECGYQVLGYPRPCRMSFCSGATLTKTSQQWGHFRISDGLKLVFSEYYVGFNTQSPAILGRIASTDSKNEWRVKPLSKSYIFKFLKKGLSNFASTLPTYALVITVTSYWVRWRLETFSFRLFDQPFVQAQIKENINVPRHWSLWGESTYQWSVVSPHEGPVTRKMFPLDDVIMVSLGAKSCAGALMTKYAICAIMDFDVISIVFDEFDMDWSVNSKPSNSSRQWITIPLNLTRIPS